MNLQRSLFRAAIAALLFTSQALPGARAALDLNDDGIPDIWAMVYGSAGLAPGGDADGDGRTNAEEARQGRTLQTRLHH